MYEKDNTNNKYNNNLYTNGTPKTKINELIGFWNNINNEEKYTMPTVEIKNKDVASTPYNLIQSDVYKALGEVDKYNETIENYIIKSNANAFKKTLDSIKNLNQREAGVVLSNGCIIDGNSVFLRMISLLKHMPNTHTDLC